MIKIQVLGNGLIPRGYGLAPRTEPFAVDYTVARLILVTKGLTVNFVNPETKVLSPLTKSNIKDVFDKYNNWVPDTKAINEAVSKPVTPSNKFDSKPATSVVDTTTKATDNNQNQHNNKDKKNGNNSNNNQNNNSEKKDDSTFKPVTNSENK